MAISVGSVSVDVVPSTRGFAEQLKAKLKGITANIAVDADTSSLRAQLDEAIRSRTATINVNADTAFAEAQIATVAQDRTANIRIGTSGLSSAVSGMSGLAATIAILGPALIPITAAVAGLAIALAAPLAAAGGGLTIGALVGGFAIKDTLEQKKAIEDLAEKVEASKLRLEKAATPAGRRSAALQLAADTQAYQAALAGLSPVQKKFLESLDRLKDSFKGLVTSTGGAIFAPFIKGMDLLAKVMPSLKPLIVAVSSAVGTLLDDLGKAASSPGFKKFVRSFGREAGDAIVGFGRTFGNFAKGLVNLFRAFAPASGAFADGLAGSARAFANWTKSLGSSKSFQAFLGYVREVGPKVASALGHMFEALGKLATVLAPLGGVVLALVDGLSQMIIKADPAQLAAIGAALGTVAVAVAALGGPAVAIPAAIVAIGAALAYAYSHSTKFRDVVDTIGRVFTDHLFPALRDAAQKVWPALVRAFDSVKESVRDNQGLFMVIGDVLKGLGKVLVDKVLPAVADFYSVYLPLLGKAIGGGITAVRLIGNAFLVMAIGGLSGFKLLVQAALATFGAILTAADAGLGWIPGLGDKIHGAKKAFDAFQDNTVAALEAAIVKAQDLQAELNFKPKTIKIHYQVDRAPATLGPGGLPIFKPEGAGARGAIINRPTVLLAGEAGPEKLMPLDQTPGNAPLPGAAPGPQFNVERVVAQDVNDFLRQMQTRARQTAIGGIPAGAA